MELTHSFTVPTSVEDAWALFTDLEAVGSCFPGATVTEVTDDGFSGTVKVKLGPIALVYAGSGSFVQRDDAGHEAVIEAKGKDKRGNGTAGATVHVRLRPDGVGMGAETAVGGAGRGATRVDVTTDLAVTGKPAQFGRGVMQDVSDKLLQAFVSCVEQQLTVPSVADPGAAGAATAGAPAAAPVPAATVPEATVPEATVQDAAEAASHPEIVTEAVPHEVTGPSAHPSLAEEVARSKAEASGAAVAARTTGPARPAAPARDVHGDALDLGSAVLPVLVQRYAGYAGVGLVGLLLGWLLGRRGRSGRHDR